MATKKNTIEDVFAFTAFDPSKISESYREFTEKGLGQSKEAYDKMKSAAEDATKTMEQTLETVQAGTVEMGLKAIDQIRANTEQSLSHLEALLGVKSVSEFIELQTSFLRSQSETAVDQAKVLQEASRKFVDDVAKPGKAAYEKVAKTLKVA
jgi:phasin